MLTRTIIFYEQREIDRETEMNLNNAQGEIAIRENRSSRKSLSIVYEKVHLSFQSSMALYIMKQWCTLNPPRNPRHGPCVLSISLTIQDLYLIYLKLIHRYKSNLLKLDICHTYLSFSNEVTYVISCTKYII